MSPVEDQEKINRAKKGRRMAVISYSQNSEDVMLWRALKHVDKGFYVDIGAWHPVVDSVSKAFYDRGWRGVHVEPVPEYARLLREYRPDETVLQNALSDVDEEIDFIAVKDLPMSTADKSVANRIPEQYKNRVELIKVQAITLKKTLIPFKGRDVHWMKIDVEGWEHKVLKGWDPEEIRPWIVVIESKSPFSQEENFLKWEPLLTGSGYNFAYFDGLNRFYISGEHSELKAAFSCPPNVFDDFVRIEAVERDSINLQLQAILQTRSYRYLSIKGDWEFSDQDEGCC